MKLIWLLFLASLACRMFTGRWPWELIGGSARSAEQGRSTIEKQARTLLGVRGNATRDEIIEAHRRLLTRVHPDVGGSSDQVHAANAARDLLLDRVPLN